MYEWQKKLLKAYCEADTKDIMFMAGRRAGKSTTMLNWADTLKGFTQGYKLTASTGKVFGQDYYCVEPTGWIWRNEIEWKDMVAWCEETMEREPDTITPNLRWYVNGGMFWFRDETDRTMFMLRWA